MKRSIVITETYDNGKIYRVALETKNGFAIPQQLVVEEDIIENSFNTLKRVVTIMNELKGYTSELPTAYFED